MIPLGSSLTDVYYEEVKQKFEKADQNFKLFVYAASILMPHVEDNRSNDIEAFANEKTWNAMSIEQKTKASELRIAIAEKLSDYGITTESLRVVMDESEAGEKTFTLIHTGNGIDIGDHSKDYDEARSYKSVMAKKNNPLFFVRVGDKVHDVRTGMTDKAYYALVADARERGEALPDSKQMSRENDDLWTWAMLTGEPLTAVGYVRIRYVDVDGVYRLVSRPDFDARGLRVRPAVVIE